MYTRDTLIQYDYFKKVLDGHRISDVLEPLTGLINRTYLFGFVRSLIEERIPFTFGMIDLDNFKYINDTYGHSTGDEVLCAVADRLSSFLAGYGIAGRFGGDEFFFVNLRHLEYDDKKVFCSGLFDKVLRKSYRLKEYELFVTGTVGLATYPLNTDNFDELFLMIDKTLYRGKSKGRNCYIIYVEEKHRNIEIIKLRNNTLFETFKNLTQSFDQADSLNAKLKAGYEVLKNDLHITDMYYSGQSRIIRSMKDDHSIGYAKDIDKLMDDLVYSTNNLKDIEGPAPLFYGLLKENEIEALMIMRVNLGEKEYGYLMCAEPHTLRIWQENEQAIMFLFARMLSGYLDKNNTELD